MDYRRVTSEQVTEGNNRLELASDYLREALEARNAILKPDLKKVRKNISAHPDLAAKARRMSERKEVGSVLATAFSCAIRGCLSGVTRNQRRPRCSRGRSFSGSPCSGDDAAGQLDIAQEHGQAVTPLFLPGTWSWPRMKRLGPAQALVM